MDTVQHHHKLLQYFSIDNWNEFISGTRCPGSSQSIWQLWDPPRSKESIFYNTLSTSSQIQCEHYTNKCLNKSFYRDMSAGPKTKLFFNNALKTTIIENHLSRITLLIQNRCLSSTFSRKDVQHGRWNFLRDTICFTAQEYLTYNATKHTTSTNVVKRNKMNSINVQ